MGHLFGPSFVELRFPAWCVYLTAENVKRNVSKKLVTVAITVMYTEHPGIEEMSAFVMFCLFARLAYKLLNSSVTSSI